ncbi:hypothetical protein A4G99_19965 [Haladaptatus sp. R4]|uniref:hypothetical protein n=1 Tax=Haladaptatus sp. R4 TaxID=1679489 RepID=UPI0007B4E126|nr:hypothetical protein [Haladaptatus sp. R4]KZN22481.1 hypothetical protein A4G99_19965 [Haladaptatus sp. R4]
MVEFNLQNPWIFVPVMVVIWAVIWAAIGTLVFDKQGSYQLFIGGMGGLAFGLMTVYLRRDEWKAPKNNS